MRIPTLSAWTLPPALQVLTTRRITRRDTAALILAVGLLVLWLILVLLVTSTHEYWRDEVRPWSLARQATSPLEVVRLIRSDGHPPLWYWLLWLGVHLVDSPLVLPALSLLVAAAAVVLFLWLAPFPLWMRAVFVFSALPFYVYSVMARNYGLGMLLMFICAVFYSSRRQHPWRLAWALALLAKSSAHAAVLAGMLTAAWVLDALFENKTLSPRVLGRRLYAPLGLVAAGLALSFAVTSPTADTVLTQAPSATPAQTLLALASALARPSISFSQIFPLSPGIIGDVLIFVAVFGLLRRPPLFLAALGGQIAFGVLFRLVYAGYYRHQGLFLIFLLTLYWIALETSDPDTHWVVRRRSFEQLFFAGQYLVLVPVLFAGLIYSFVFAYRDISEPLSSSRYFGAFLRASPELADAIIVPEPDYRLESLPYYVDNLIYLPREHRFSPTVSWTTASQPVLSLGELLSTARRLQQETGRPVLIALGHFDLDPRHAEARTFSYNHTFTWTSAELTEFYRSTDLVAEYMGALSDENYRVYQLKSVVY